MHKSALWLSWSKCLSCKQDIPGSNPSSASFAIPMLCDLVSEHTQDVKILEQRNSEEGKCTSRLCGLVGQSACIVNMRSCVRIPAVPHLPALCHVIYFHDHTQDVKIVEQRN